MGVTVVDLRTEEFKYALHRLRDRRQGEAKVLTCIRLFTVLGLTNAST
jgi:hypothetical protein